MRVVGLVLVACSRLRFGARGVWCCVSVVFGLEESVFVGIILGFNPALTLRALNGELWGWF